MANGDVIIKILGDDTDLNKKLKGAGGMASTAMKAVAAGAAAAGAAVAALGKSALDAYASYEQLAGGVQTLFGESAAATVSKYAAEAYKTAGMSANAYMETVTSVSASLMQSLGGDAEAAAHSANEAIAAMADNASKMGTSMETIVQTYQSLARGNYAMLDNLKLGYGGTKAELERLLKDAEAYKASMGESVDYDISNFADITEAIDAIQEKMGLAGSAAEEASTTIEGSVNAMKAAWQNMLVGIADENADFEGLLGNLLSSVGTAAENVLPRIKVILEGIAKLAVEMAPTLVTTAVELVTSLAQYISENAPILLQKAPELVAWLAETIAENAPKLLEAAGQLIVSLATGVIDAVPTLVAKAPEIVGSLAEGVRGMLGSMVQAGVDLIDGLAAGVRNAIPNLLKAAGEVGSRMLEKVKAVFKIQSPSKVMRDEIGAMLVAGVADGIEANTQTAIDAATAMADGILSSVGNIAKAVNDGTVAAIEETSDQEMSVGMEEEAPVLVEKTQELLEKTLQVIMDNEPAFRDSGEMLMQGVAKGVQDGRSALINTIVAVLQAAVAAARATMGIASPSKVMAEIGRYMAQGLNVGWTKEMDTAATDIEESLYSNMESRMTNAYARMKTAMSDGVNRLTGDIAVQARGASSYTTNHNTTTEGDFIIQIEKIVNDGKGTVAGMMEEFEFIRRQKALAKGGA